MTSSKQKRPVNRDLRLRLPKLMEKRLKRDAKRKRCTLQTVVTRIIAAHYEIEVKDPKRGRPPKEN